MNAPLEDLVEHLGLALTLRLVERFSGTRVYLPHPDNLEPESPIAQVLGLEAARRLCALWPQERPYIPRAAQILRERRDRQLLADSASMSVPQLARKYDLGESAVYRALGRARAAEDAAPALEPAQKPLF